MSHVYCVNCVKPIEQEDYSVQDVENQYYQCTKCGQQNPCHMTMSEVIENLQQRVAQLEKRQSPETYNDNN